jgi:hypothetical protein
MTTVTDNPEEKKPSSLAYASCIVRGDDLEPDFWTENLGVTPDGTAKRGEPFILLSGRISAAPSKFGFWRVSSKMRISTDELNPHIEYLINILKLPRANLKDLLTERKATMHFSCYWNNYSGDRVPTINSNFVEAINLSGGIIEIDEYPQRQKFLDDDGREHSVWV